MSAPTAAFERLGVAPTRDVKSIKRAYAVALKAIDQASEREAFEQLRRAYEQALAWAARADDADDEMEDEDEEPDEKNDEDQDDHDQDHRGDFDRAGHHAPAPPPVDPPRRDAPSSFTSPAAPATVALSLGETHQALRHWTDQLRDAPNGAVAAVFEAALVDPRLLHLDSHAQLESRIADLLHDDPTGRAALFDAAARHFHWTERNARPIAGAEAAQWISRVVNQGLQWHAQAPATTALQLQALDTVARVAAPQQEEVRRFAQVLADMAGDFPDWFALHLAPQGHVHLPAWQAVSARLAPRWARQDERRQRYFGTRRKTVNTLLGVFLVLLLASALFSGVMSRLLGNPAPRAAAASTHNSGSGKVGVGASPATPEPVLAYEFTGAVTLDSCESAEEFVHESNWLQVGDSDAVALLATRAMRCQDKGLWSRNDDSLMTCLRAERAAALGAGRLEDAPRCLPSKPAAGSAPPASARLGAAK